MALVSARMFGVIVDKWAVRDGYIHLIMAIQTFSVLLSLVLMGLQIYSIVKNRNVLKFKWKEATLMIIQLAMMFFSTSYMLMYVWNYMMLYLPKNPIACDTWYALIMTTITFSRIFLITFLMLRSSFSFSGAFCELSPKITITVITIYAIGNLILAPIMLSDFTPISPFPGENGICWRILGDIGNISIILYNLHNVCISIVALLIFYWKARSVRHMMNRCLQEERNSDRMNAIYKIFKKHILLGMLAIAGSIVVLCLADILSVTMGVLSSLDQIMNNVFTFVMLKHNKFAYQWLVCKPKSSDSKNHEDMIKSSLPKSDEPKTIEMKSKAPNNDAIEIVTR